MKKILVVSGVILGLVLTIGLAIPAFAQEPGDGETEAADPGEWDEMHEACENGDWEAMMELAEATHQGDLEDMPHHTNEHLHPEHDDGDSDHHHRGMGGHMGSGMMSW